MAAAIPEAAGAVEADTGAATRARGSSRSPVIAPAGRRRTHNPPRAKAEADAAAYREAQADEDRTIERESIARRRKTRGGRDFDQPAPRRRSKSRTPAARVARVTLVPGTAVTVDDGAGVLLGAFLWALTLAYINPSGKHRSGPAGVRDWLRAKFLNKDTSGREIKAAASTPAPTSPLTPQSPGESTLTGPLGQSLGGSLGGAIGRQAGVA